MIKVLLDSNPKLKGILALFLALFCKVNSIKAFSQWWENSNTLKLEKHVNGAGAEWINLVLVTFTFKNF